MFQKPKVLTNEERLQKLTSIALIELQDLLENSEAENTKLQAIKEILRYTIKQPETTTKTSNTTTVEVRNF